MTHKIAIITSSYIRHDYDDYNRVIESITEWTEVSDEDFKMLQAQSHRLCTFSIIERPLDETEFVKKTVADYIQYVKKEELRAEQEKQKRAEAAKIRKYKKDLKDKESKIALLKKLQEELGTEITADK